MNTRCLLLSFLLYSLTLCAYAAPHYTVTDIGYGAYSLYSGGRVVSDRGQVTGEINNHAFLWDNGKLTPFLGAYATGWGDDEDPRASASHGNAVNALGHVAGGTGGFQPIVMNGLYDCFPFLYANDDMQNLGDGDYDSFEAFDINDHDEVVGVHAHHGFYWSHGKRIEFGTLHNVQTGTWSYSRVNAINNKGQFVGLSTVPGPTPYKPRSHAVLWIGPKQSGHWQDLGVTPGFDSSEALAINDRGDVVGTTRAAYGPSRAILWRERQQELLPLLAGNTHSAAQGINNQGEIVGWCTNLPIYGNEVPSNETAVLWHNNKAVNLNSLLPLNSGWVLSEACSINNHGWIVGSGTHNGQMHLFLLRPQ